MKGSVSHIYLMLYDIHPFSAEIYRSKGLLHYLFLGIKCIHIMRHIIHRLTICVSIGMHIYRREMVYRCTDVIGMHIYIQMSTGI